MQTPTRNVIPDASASYGLRSQSALGQYDFPFTLNPTVGCFFGCRYCYSPRAVCKVHDAKREFFENVHVKVTKPDLVKKDLKLFSTLPQHMKRVQINETSEYYLPQVMKFLKDNGHPDVMLDILDAFRKEWQAGNRWMLHILTKSPLILRHLPELKAMREQVQIEVSFATGDDSILRKIEFFTPTVKNRMNLVERLSKEGLFVRIMAMPFYGNAEKLRALQKETFDRGAQAFKNKFLNYFDWSDLIAPPSFDDYLNANTPRQKGRTDDKDESLIIKSGEYVYDADQPRLVSAFLPSRNAKGRLAKGWATRAGMNTRFVSQPTQVIDSGYAACNNVDWGYVL